MKSLNLILILVGLFSVVNARAGDPYSDTGNDGDTPTTAVIEHSPAFDLYVDSIKGAEITEIQKSPEGALYGLSLEISLTVLPDGCNTFFLRNELVAKSTVKAGQDIFNDKDLTFAVELGTMLPLGDAFSTCVGVPPRPARLKLPLQ